MMPRTIIRFLILTLLCGAGGYAGYVQFELVGRDWMAVVIGASAALMTLLAVISTQVLGKLDKVLDAADKFEIRGYVEPVYCYVSDIRHRFVVSFLVGGICGVLNTGIAVALPKDTVAIETAHLLAAVGSGALTFVVLYGIRALNLYMELDGFRHDLNEAVAREHARARAIVELTHNRIEPFRQTLTHAAG